MSITQAMCDSFKVQILSGQQNLVSGASTVYKLALYTSSASLSNATTAYTTVLSDTGKHIIHPSSDNNARTFTIANNSSVAYPLGTILTFVNMANVLTIAINNDTMYASGYAANTGSRTLTAYGVASAIKVGTTTWVISGTNLT